MYPEDRSCLVGSELKYENLGVELHAFKNYTKANCMLECQAAAMLKTCKCLTYSFPIMPDAFIKQYIPTYNSSHDIFCYEDLICIAKLFGMLKHLYEVLLSMYFYEASMGALSEGGEGMNGFSCNCPDNCDDVIYSQVLYFKMGMFHRFVLGNFIWTVSRFK